MTSIFEIPYARPVPCVNFGPGSQMVKPSESKRNAKGWDLWILVGQKDDFDETKRLPKPIEK